jgi:signal transduction histidine kinase/DNA-binding response OmpR family regulator/CHASE3 domain sensor protein
MKSTVNRNLQVGFGLSLIILIISSVASYISISNLLKSSKLVSHTTLVIQKLDNVMSTLKDAETGQRGYLLTNDPSFLDPYNGAYDRTVKLLDSISVMTTDNPKQTKNTEELKEIVMTRLTILKRLIDKKNATQIVTIDDLREGKNYMDQVRRIINTMVNEENELLATRTASMNRFASFTPVIIVFAAILALIITLYFYSRIVKDFKERSRLQRELQDKDIETSNRIDIIQNIAEKISAGNYETRVKDEEKDGLGSLSFSLNKMAESLDFSFNLLSDKEWLQTGVARLNENMVGEKAINNLASDVIKFLAAYTGSQIGALYLVQNESLKLTAGYALKNAGEQKILKFGEGLAGQCALNGKEILLEDIPAQNLTISFAAGEAKPQNIVAYPLYHEGSVNGVVELATIRTFTKKDMEFLEAVSSNIGIAIHSAQSRQRLQELLEETQSQSEELQSQHSELENLNADLEAQTQKLQASDEELRVQQEELVQANEELEERSRLLEEKNQTIVERNLDIQRKAEELELSTRYKSEFLANMSHELRTPLNSILLLSRLMAENNENNLNSEQVESAKVIQSSGNGLLSLIDEILDLSKIEAGKMDLEYLSTPLEEIAGDMKSLFTPIAREKGLQLDIDIDPAVPSSISTDKMRLEQILKNLLSNALKFTTRGNVSFRIAPLADNPELIQFIVKDTGIGIPKDKQRLIFEAFQQADGSTKRKYGGTGLGLSISRELVKLLGGEIKINSEPGKGSEFIVYIPVYKPHAIQINRQEPESESAIYEGINEVEPDVPRYIAPVIPPDVPDDRADYKLGDKVILIVEDDVVFARALLNFAHSREYKGIVAVRGDLAIEMALQYMPAAILLDIQLPVKDGWQVMEELKSNPRTRHIPVHIMSSMQVKKESLIKGAVDFMDKPVALDQMKQMFQTLEDALNRNPRKVLIVEENPKHAKALAYFLETFNINAEIRGNVNDGVNALKKKEVNCVILDMGIPDQNAYETLEVVKQTTGLENLPIIIFTGKNLSKAEENRIKQYADSIVVKTAHSYQRILDEVALFLHLIEENKDSDKKPNQMKKLGALNEILKDRTVLVADDDVRNIFSLTRALEQHKMKVVSAIDGKEALRQLEENPQIDIVLMDMMMPEMDGYESTTRIRKNPKFRNLPILAVTAKAMLGDREKCIQAGASDYISKPVDIDQLISLLRVWLYDKAI